MNKFETLHNDSNQMTLLFAADGTKLAKCFYADGREKSYDRTYLFKSVSTAINNSTLAIFGLPQAAKCLKLRRGGKLEGVWTNERRILTPRYFSCAL